MKKLFSLLLVVAIGLGLCACKAEEAPVQTTTEVATEATFSVGFGRVNITPSPTTGVPLEGYDDRLSEGVLNFVMATCVAITDTQDQTILLYTVDVCDTEKENVEALREKLSAQTGIPGNNITISGTHTHSGPEQSHIVNYVDLLVEVGLAALEDRTPATIQTGSYDVPNMNFDRHYVMNDGTMSGDNYGDSTVGRKEHVSIADPTMRLIRFQREDKKDVLMVNWQVHPKLASTADTQEGKATRNLISADFIGFTRDYVEKAQEDVLFAYYTGASGNVNPFSKLTEEKNIVTKQAKAYGEQFGDHVIAALAQLTPAQSGNVGSKSAPMGDRGFTMHAYTIGSSIGFATVPAEIFHQTGTQIRENSACDITFVVTIANGRDTYIPIDEVWDYTVNTAQRPYEERICRYPRGTAEAIAQELGQMLTELAGK